MVSMYTKAIVAFAAAAAAALVTAVGNGSLDDLDSEGWVKVALLVVGSTAAVWWAENVPGVAGGVIKAVLAGAGAFLAQIQVSFENDGVISQGEWLTAVSLALAALTAVYQLKNVPPSG